MSKRLLVVMSVMLCCLFIGGCGDSVVEQQNQLVSETGTLLEGIAEDSMVKMSKSTKDAQDAFVQSVTDLRKAQSVYVAASENRGLFGWKEKLAARQLENARLKQEMAQWDYESAKATDQIYLQGQAERESYASSPAGIFDSFLTSLGFGGMTGGDAGGGASVDTGYTNKKSKSDGGFFWIILIVIIILLLLFMRRRGVKRKFNNQRQQASGGGNRGATRERYVESEDVTNRRSGGGSSRSRQADYRSDFSVWCRRLANKMNMDADEVIADFGGDSQRAYMWLKDEYDRRRNGGR